MPTDPRHRNRAQLQGLARASAAMALVGGAVTAAAFLTDYPRFAAQAVRYGAAALLLTGLAATFPRLGLRRPRGRDWWWLVASATAGQSGYNLALLAAVSSAEPAVVGTVVAGVPLVLALALPLASGRRPPPRLVACAGVVVVGAALVYGGGRSDPAGLGWSVVALAGEAGFTLLAVPVLARLGPASVAIHTSWIAAAQFTVLAILSDGVGGLPVPDGAVVLAVAYLVGASAAAFVLWFAAVGAVGGELAGLSAGIIPLAAAASGWLVGRTSPTPGLVVGTAVVAVGLVGGLASARRSTPALRMAPPAALERELPS